MHYRIIKTTLLVLKYEWEQHGAVQITMVCKILFRPKKTRIFQFFFLVAPKYRVNNSYYTRGQVGLDLNTLLVQHCGAMTNIEYFRFYFLKNN